ncbi:MAG: hypothetical protein QF554_02985 [Dehalococcoidia bacterium]|jgi:hypothetical protein|nr:hypothetical protein [Dehalococcoidia bacterium]
MNLSLTLPRKGRLPTFSRRERGPITTVSGYFHGRRRTGARAVGKGDCLRILLSQRERTKVREKSHRAAALDDLF